MRVINFGGVIFEVPNETLFKIPYSDFKGQLSGRIPVKLIDGIPFFEKSPEILKGVLRLLDSD